ncbi:unnamed protein product [Effrenium voratum]|uniref:Uncharacterized protein n=1 Tax=Effrenium voratum TaxID=2562239 RepID=A0AA36JDJ5_9DINO|nr:unnamed protein product [Effrenium voratum]
MNRLLPALLCMGSLAMRPQSETRDPADAETLIDPSDLEDPTAPKLAPFELDVIIDNEEAVLQKYEGRVAGTLLYDVVPEQDSLDSAASAVAADLQERLQKELGTSCVIQKEGTHGKTVKLVMELTGYKLDNVLPPKVAKDLASAMSSLEGAILAVGGVQSVYDDVLSKVKAFLKAKWEEKIPRLVQGKLLENQVEANVVARPCNLKVSPAPVPLPPVAVHEPTTPFETYLRVEIADRLPLARSVNSSLQAADLQNLTQSKYLALIKPKLEEKVARAIREQLGDAFPFQAAAESDSDFGQQSRHSFWLGIRVFNFEEMAALRKVRGETFAGNVQRLFDLLDSLRSCGVPELDGADETIHSSLRHGPLRALHAGFEQKIRNLLGVELQAVSAAIHGNLQKLATEGVCCRSERRSRGGVKPDEVFWVTAEVSDGDTDSTHNGYCPSILVTLNPPCVSEPSSRVGVVALHHRPYTECFNMAALQDFRKAVERTAPLVSTTC